jgi:hypothetical protein
MFRNKRQNIESSIITIFSAGVAVGRIIERKNDRP